MKPKEFIEKYNLSKGWNPRKQSQFLTDMTSELIALLELNHAQNNIKGFDNAVHVIRMKWDAISNKVPFGLPDKLWGYFFATVIAPTRDDMCPEEMAHRREQAAKRREAYEERKRMRERWEREFYDDLFDSYYAWMAAMLLHIDRKPIDSLQVLGLNENATLEDVKSAYRKLSMQCHPDKGGDKELFITITDAKNRCVSYFNSHK